MIYKTFEEWKAGHWLEDGEPRTEAYTEDELLLVEMGWKYGFDAGKEQTKPQQWHMVNKDGYVKPLSDEEIEYYEHLIAKLFNCSTTQKVIGLDRVIRA